MRTGEAEWILNGDFAERQSFKSYQKKHSREFAACFANLDRLTYLLNTGMMLEQVGSSKFFSSEGGGIFRIAQTGVKHAKESRLYIYVHIEGKTIYLLIIGDKDTQKMDLQKCRKIKAAIVKTLGKEQR